jgi:predicted metal-dependent phosphoesterase TrpH
MKADLHLHSTFSDGSMSPGQIVLAAKRAGLGALAITDHDTTSHVALAVELGRRYGLSSIAGIEISAFDFQRKRKVHILGYGFRLPALAIEHLCGPLRAARHANSLRAIESLRALGYPIDADEVAAAWACPPVLYKQHLMSVLSAKDLADGIYGLAYRRLFKGDGPCSGDIVYADACDAVEAVKRDGGLAFLAHPGQTDSFDLVPALVEAGLDGIEVSHPDNEPSQRERAAALCAGFGLLQSGGSDAHGTLGDEPGIGGVLSPEGSVGEILARITQNSSFSQKDVLE